MMPRAPLALLGLLSAGAAHAEGAKPSATPCVNRESIGWRQVRDIKLDAKTLDYCTGDDCWSIDLATMAAVNVPKRPTTPPQAPDPAGLHTDGHGTKLATADATHVEFCPGGKPPCKSFPIALSVPASAVYPTMNDAGTLGAVLYRGPGDIDPKRFLLAFDISRGKPLGKMAGSDIVALDHGFLVDDVNLYSATMTKVGKLAAHDEVWVKLATTDRIALRDVSKGQFVIQDTTTAKVLSRIPTGVPDPKAFFSLVPAPDGKTVYAIGWVSDEGEVIKIDPVAGKITTRTTPIVCAAGTHRVN